MELYNEVYNAELLGAIARGYCHDENSHKVLDPDLCFAIAREVQDYLDRQNYIDRMSR